MSERRNYHRFPKGQTCEQCPSKRWYSEDGRRYCDRGHEIEGFVERGFEDENAFGQTGHIARKEKEARERVSRTLSGNASRELYLQCLQLVLRKQLFWLVRDRGLPPELETVVRDLWALRTRNLAGLKTVADARREAAEGGDDEPGGSALGSGAETDTPELKMYSSEGSGVETDGGLSDATGVTAMSSRARSWSTDISSKRSLPTLIDTLALCYLGTLLMRLPVRVGDLFVWGKNNQITYLDAIRELPKEMRTRLPSRYQRILSARVSPFSGGELHEAVLWLAESFNANYKLKFPPLNEPLLLLRYTRELALPIEVYAFVQGMVEFLNVDFKFPLEQRRVKLLDHPDVFLVACTVLATKLLCPFDSDERFSKDVTPQLTSMDWNAWRESFSEPETNTLSRRDLEKLGSEEAWTLDRTKTDDYLDWYQQAKIDEQRPNPLARFAALFPLNERERKKPVTELSESTIDERLARLQSRLKNLSTGDTGTRRPGEAHHAYRTVEDLTENSRPFYTKAAELSGMSTAKLVKAVFLLERRLDAWIVTKRQAERAQREDSDA